MQEWPDGLALVSEAQHRTDTTVRGVARSSSTDARGHAPREPIEDRSELDRIVLHLQLEGGLGLGQMAEILGVEQRVVGASLLRAMDRLHSYPQPDAAHRPLPQRRADPEVSTGMTDSLVGRTLSRYRVLELIGCGGMGVVYRGFDRALRREVALKLLRADRVADLKWRLRFRQEARTAASLEHPHICLTHEIDEVDGVLFIAMELIRGECLLDVLHRPRRAGGAPRPLAAAASSSTRSGDRDRAGSGSRARAGDRPPRSQARQHHDHRVRTRQAHRLRAGETPRALELRRRRPPRDRGRGSPRSGLRDSLVHVARTEPWTRGRPEKRHLHIRCAPSRDADRDEPAAAPNACGNAKPSTPSPRPAEGAGSDIRTPVRPRPMHGQGSGRSLSEHARPARGSCRGPFAGGLLCVVAASCALACSARRSLDWRACCRLGRLRSDSTASPRSAPGPLGRAQASRALSLSCGRPRPRPAP